MSAWRLWWHSNHSKYGKGSSNVLDSICARTTILAHVHLYNTNSNLYTPDSVSLASYACQTIEASSKLYSFSFKKAVQFF